MQYECPCTYASKKIRIFILLSIVTIANNANFLITMWKISILLIMTDFAKNIGGMPSAAIIGLNYVRYDAKTLDYIPRSLIWNCASKIKIPWITLMTVSHSYITTSGMMDVILLAQMWPVGNHGDPYETICQLMSRDGSVKKSISFILSNDINILLWLFENCQFNIWLDRICIYMCAPLKYMYQCGYVIVAMLFQCGYVIVAMLFQCGSVIVATPPWIQNSINYEPTLSAKKRALLQRIPMGACVKTKTTYSNAFWRKDGNLYSV